MDWHGSEAGGVIGQTIGDDQLVAVKKGATRIDDVGHVAFTLVLVGFEQRFAKPTDHFGRIITIEQERSDTVLSQGANTVAEDQPARVGLDGGPAVRAPFLATITVQEILPSNGKLITAACFSYTIYK